VRGSESVGLVLDEAVLHKRHWHKSFRGKRLHALPVMLASPLRKFIS
jgi:hypothetical protein